MVRSSAQDTDREIVLEDEEWQLGLDSHERVAMAVAEEEERRKGQISFRELRKQFDEEKERKKTS